MDFSDLINKYTLVTAGVMTLIISGITIFQKVRELRKAEKNAEEQQALKGSTAPLVRHSLLVWTIPKYLHIFYNMFRLETETKTNLFRDVLIHKIEAYQKYLKVQSEYIDNQCKKNCKGGNCHIDLGELIAHNNQLLEHIIVEYSSFYNTEACYSEEEKRLAHHAVSLLEQSDASHVSIIRYAISAMTANAKYTDCSKVLQASVFCAYETAIHSMLYNLETSLGRANGYFKDKAYPDKYLASKGGRIIWK